MMILTKRHTSALNLLAIVRDINDCTGIGPTKRGIVSFEEVGLGRILPEGTKRHHYRSLSALVDSGYLVNMGEDPSFSLYITSRGRAALAELWR